MLSSLATRVRKGFQPDSYIDDGGVLVVKSKDVRYPDFSLSLCDRTAEADWPFLLEGGELLINSTGEGTLGRATVVPPLAQIHESVIPSVDLLVVDVDAALIMPEYLAVFLNSPIGRRLSTALQTGSSGQQHLNPVHFSLLPVPIRQTEDQGVDWAWQQAIVDLVEQRAARLQAAEKVTRELDDEFVRMVGVNPDLATIPK